MNTTTPQILTSIAAATTAKQLHRLRDHIVPCALISNADQDKCRAAIVERFVQLNQDPATAPLTNPSFERIA